MSDQLSQLHFPVWVETHSQADIVRQAEEQRQWWQKASAELTDGGSTADPCPITLTCDLTGQVTSVRFAPGSKSHMTDSSIRDALREAVKRVQFSAPDLDPQDNPEQEEVARASQTVAVLRWLDDIMVSRADLPRREAKSDDGAVSVVYSGNILADIRVLQRDWALFSSEEQIETAVVQASKRALGVPGSGVSPGWPVSSAHGRR